MSATFARLKKQLPALDRELNALFAKYGLKVVLRNAGVSGLEVKFNIRTEDTQVDPATAERVLRDQYEAKCFRVGLKPEWFGKEMTFPGRPGKYRIVGVNTRKKKYPVVLESTTGGKGLLTTAFSVQSTMRSA